MGRGIQHRTVWLYCRRFSQLFFCLVFLFLFVKTDYRGEDQLQYAVNIFFRLDPYLAAVTMLSSRSLVALMYPGLVVLFLALLLGRSFCGWFCPMGSVLDGCRIGLTTDMGGRKTLYPRLGRLLLFLTLVLALFGFHVAGYLDPFSLLVRGFVQSLYPAFHSLVDHFFSFTYSSAPGWVNGLTEPVYDVLKDHVLPSEQKHFELVFLSGALLAGVIFLEMAQKRFFCRNLCPLGALLGMVAKKGAFKGCGGSEECGNCRICASICRMGAIDEERRIDMASCNLCLECTVKCPRQIISFGVHHRNYSPAVETILSRRQFLGAIIAGVILPQFKGTHVMAKRDDPLLIRPPGALMEDNFLGRCVRCGECMQVCIGNVLQPALLEGGLDAAFSPKLVARTGYCEFNCTLCGQVCPTGAISVLTVPEKHNFKIGHAWFDKDRCLPYAKAIPCMVCEEHCPTATKAIRFNQARITTAAGKVVEIKQPYVVDELCIGCGICEYKCPLPGNGAIYVTNAGEHRHPHKQLPQPDPGPGASSPYG